MPEKLYGRVYMTQEKGKSIKSILAACLVVCLLQVVILFVNYHKVDLSYPLAYGDGDVMAVFSYAKTIDEYGISLENPMLGGASGFNMYDYPYSDSLSFLMVKGIGLFTDNPFLIINLFYFLCSVITALVSFLVLQKYLDSFLIAGTLGLLYANSFYFQIRYTHIWLIPYFFLPVACSLAIDIINGNITARGNGIWKNSSFYKALILAFCCAFTGLYYAYFTCALIAAAMVIRWISSGKLKGNLYPVLLIASTGLGVFLNVLPSILYWMKSGPNPEGELALRDGSSAEVFGLKIIQMFLPRSGHRIGKLASLADRYKTSYLLVNENETASIGLIAAIGFVIAIVWLFGKEQARQTYSYLIISVVLIATIGGISSMISLVVSLPVRCYNRMSLIVMFLSLLCFGTWLKGLLRKRAVWITAAVCAVVLCIGIFDQTQTAGLNAYPEVYSTESFVKEVEAETGPESSIFELPYVRWPSDGNYRLFAGYLYSDDLHWSYGAMQGREEARWQQETASLGTNEMVAELLKNGYDGIYVDMAAYEGVNGEGSFASLQNGLNELLQTGPVVSADGNLYFWKLPESGEEAVQSGKET